MTDVTPVTRLDTASAVDVVNANFTKLAQEFDKVVYRSSGILTGTLDADGNPIINLPNATLSQQAVPYGQMLAERLPGPKGEKGEPGQDGITPTNITGNAGTATKLLTARTINGVAFDGTSNITVSAVDTVTPRGALSLANTWTGMQTFSGMTTAFTGNASFPGSANNNAYIYRSDNLGLVLYGMGATVDVYIGNRTGAKAMSVPGNTVNVEFGGTILVPGTATFSAKSQHAQGATMRSGSTLQLNNADESIAYSLTNNGSGISSNGNLLAPNIGSAAAQTYTEGTFTPTMTFGGSSTGITYSLRVARYTRVGRLITVEVNINLSSKGTSTGAVMIGGLPFTSNSVIPAGGATFAMAKGWNNTAGIFAAVLAGSSAIKLYGNSPATPGSYIDITDANASNISELYFTLTYSI